VYSLAFTADGKTLASGSEAVDKKHGRSLSGEVKLWDVASGKEIASLKAHVTEVRAVAFAPDGVTLASCGDNTVKLWDVKARKVGATLHGHTQAIFAMALAPGGRTLASGSSDGTVKLWVLARPPERQSAK
jgi:WD40 repeat protein